MKIETLIFAIAILFIGIMAVKNLLPIKMNLQNNQIVINQVSNNQIYNIVDNKIYNNQINNNIINMKSNVIENAVDVTIFQ